MATNKNQHYVPQVYLRQFASSGSTTTINLFNIDRKSFIERASIKNQCSKSYFYGADLHLEKALQPLESRYSSIVSEVSSPDYKATDAHCLFLKRFWLLQYMRTEAASRRAMEMTERMGEVIGDTAEKFKLSLDEAVRQSMVTFGNKMDVIDDLSACFLKNKSEVDLITSDDPAVLTNRWHIQDQRTKGKSFGLRSAGALCVLPLSPSILFIAYDQYVYSLQQKNGWGEIKKKCGAEAFNELQFLNCRANVYTRSNASRTELLSLYSLIEPFRPSSRFRINYAILDKETDGYKKYIVIDPKNAPQHSEAVVHYQSIPATPRSWPRQIRLREDGYFYTNGTGAGYLRREHAEKMQPEGFQKKKIGK